MTHTKPLTAVSTAGTGGPSQGPVKLEIPCRPYTERMVRVAGCALGVLAAGFAARALYLVISGVSVLTPAFAVSAVLSAICCVAFLHLRAQANAVAALRKAALDVPKDPEVPRPEVVNQDAKTLSYKDFCRRHGVEAIARITDDASLRRLFSYFLCSLREAYIKPGYPQQEYETALPHFMRPHLREEFQKRWDTELRLDNASWKFLQALNLTETYIFDYGGALAAINDPGERLQVNQSEVYRHVVSREFDTYTLGAFMKRNGSEAFKYLPKCADRDFINKLEEFVDIKREKNPGVTAKDFDSYIEAICAARAGLRTPLIACVQEKFKQPPPASSVSAPLASAAAAADPSKQFERAFLTQLTSDNFSLSRKGMTAIFDKVNHERLAITYEELAPLVVNRELRRYTYQQFMYRNGPHAARYVDDRRLLRQKFLTYVEQICSQSPPFMLRRFESDIDDICMTPQGQPRPDIDRSALEREVSRISEAPAAPGN